MASDQVMVNDEEVEPGEPVLHIAGLNVWIRGRAYPESMSYWDGNWLDIVAVCSYPGSLVRTTGQIIHLREIKRLLQTCENLRAQTHGEAGLYCIEPELNVGLTARPKGPIAVRISITPDYHTQTHVFLDKITRRDLNAIKLSCRKILEEYEIRSDCTEEGPVVLNV